MDRLHRPPQLERLELPDLLYTMLEYRLLQAAMQLTNSNLVALAANRHANAGGVNR